MSALIIGGCASSRPAPVVERAAVPAPRPAKPPVPPATAIAQPAPVAPAAATSSAQPSPAPVDGVVAAPLKAPGGAVEARPLGTEAPPAAPVAAPTIQGKVLTEPKGVRLPYSDQALAQLSQPAPRVESKPEVRPPERDTPRAPDELDWIWPVGGKVLSTFNDTTNKGIAIGGRLGQPIVAAAPGRVIFSGQGIRGFGRLVVIKHNETYLSVYAHNNQLLVKEGQTVTRGQRIAEMGNSDTDQVKLYFEIRRFGKPLDPLKVLPPFTGSTS